MSTFMDYKKLKVKRGRDWKKKQQSEGYYGDYAECIAYKSWRLCSSLGHKCIERSDLTGLKLPDGRPVRITDDVETPIPHLRY